MENVFFRGCKYVLEKAGASIHWLYNDKPLLTVLEEQMNSNECHVLNLLRWYPLWACVFNRGNLLNPIRLQHHAPSRAVRVRFIVLMTLMQLPG